jgi:hypothetical protein
MSMGPIRPRFKLVVQGSLDEQIAKIEGAVAQPTSGCVSRTLDNHIDFTVVEEARHRWSPCVQLELHEMGDGETLIHGLVGPHPNTWTLYAFINISIVVASGLALMFGLSQLTLGQRPWAMWGVAGGVGLLGGMYVLSQVGRRLASEQTHTLIALLEDALGVVIREG